MHRNSPATSMITRKTAGYGSCGAILIACLAAANMPTQDVENVRARVPAAAPPGVDAIVGEVRSQASKLHARMAHAPVPEANPRNPFAFADTPRRPRGESGLVQAAVAAEAPAPVAPAAPALLLIGVAEDASPAGPRRTAIISGTGGALYMVTEGDAVADRYTVTRIGADAVELEDVVTKGYRRLALR
jgi:lipoprotein-anchoring transpeptidase ErfK/SrfK